VRRASSMTIRSGFITSRSDTRLVSRRISFIAMRLATRPWTSSRTASPGSFMSSTARANGRAASRMRLCCGNTRSSHQRATSGNDSSRSVSPVGAQSTTTTSCSPASWWRLSASSENSSSRPGGTVSSSALMRSTPRSISIEPSQSCTPFQLRSSSAWAETCWPHRHGPIGAGSVPSGTCSASASECAGSVDSTTVRSPAAAQRRAVAAATDVFPTPPLPVYRIVRGAMACADPTRGAARSAWVHRFSRRDPPGMPSPYGTGPAPKGSP
jgi:hypothetical protein